jgi:hypothetical protein
MATNPFIAASSPAPNAQNNPWTLDAKDFLSQVSPLMAKSAFTDYEKQMGGRYSGGEGGDFTPYSDAPSNRWSQLDETPQDVTLTLADGRKWTPSGAENGIVFHPKGEVTQGNLLGNGGDGDDGSREKLVNPEDYYEVSGDASRLLGKDQAGQKITVRYKQVGDKMVPMDDPTYQGYKQGWWENVGKTVAGMVGSAALMYTGVGALGGMTGAGAAAGTAGSAGIGSGTVLGGGAATGATSGFNLASYLGVTDKIAASAINNAAVNAAVQVGTTGKIDPTALAKSTLLNMGGTLAGNFTEKQITDALLDYDLSDKTMNAIGSGANALGKTAVTGGNAGLAALGAGAGQYAGDTVKEFLGNKNPYANALASAAQGATNTAVHGGDVGKVLQGAGSSFITKQLMDRLTGSYPDLETAPPAVKNAITASVLAALNGKPITNALLNSAFSSASDYINKSLGYTKSTPAAGGTADAARKYDRSAVFGDTGYGDNTISDTETAQWLTDATNSDTANTTGGQADLDLGTVNVSGNADKSNLYSDLGYGDSYTETTGGKTQLDLGSKDVIGQLQDSGLQETSPDLADIVNGGTGNTGSNPNTLDTVTVTGEKLPETALDTVTVTGEKLPETALDTVTVIGTADPLDLGELEKLVVDPGVTGTKVTPTTAGKTTVVKKETTKNPTPATDQAMQEMQTQQAPATPLGDLYSMDLGAHDIDALLADRKRGSQNPTDILQLLAAQQSSAPQSQGSIADLMKQLFG